MVDGEDGVRMVVDGNNYDNDEPPQLGSATNHIPRRHSLPPIRCENLSFKCHFHFGQARIKARWY